jgi:hypothetical protein
MAHKTPLERDIEYRERYRTPAGVKTMIVLLFISLFLVGLYSYRLNRELLKIERDAVMMKESFNKEKVALMRQIKQLQAKGLPAEPDAQ